MFFIVGMIFACRPPLEIDASWDVTITGVETNCTDDASGYLNTYSYDIQYDGTRAKIYIDNAMYATGDHRGCSLKYTSASYLEESPDGSFSWEISGDADVESQGNSCDLPEGVDWQGTETLTVLESENPNVEVGCTYSMTVEGTFVPN